MTRKLQQSVPTDECHGAFLFMNRKRMVEHVYGYIAAVTMALVIAWPSFATTCVALPPLEHVERIRGVVFFTSGDRIGKAKVTVLMDGREIAEQATDTDGKFVFGELKAGAYEIRVQVQKLPIATTKVLIDHPEPKPKREIAVNIAVHGCSSFSLVDPKELEPDLNTNRPAHD